MSAPALTERELAMAQRVAKSLGGLMRQSTAVAAQLYKLGVDKTSMMLLGTLTTLGPQRSSALADAVFSDPSTISRQVASLVKSGYVERRADPADGRASVLAVTDLGRALVAEQWQRRTIALAGMLSHWSPADREQFAELFERFVADHEQYIPAFVTECAKRSEGEK